MEDGTVRGQVWDRRQAGIIVDVSVGLQMLHKDGVQAQAEACETSVDLGWTIGTGHHTQDVVQHVLLGEAGYELSLIHI